MRLSGTDLSSAGICSTCGEWVEKRYGGEGRYLPECLGCWTAGEEAEQEAGWSRGEHEAEGRAVEAHQEAKHGDA